MLSKSNPSQSRPERVHALYAGLCHELGMFGRYVRSFFRRHWKGTLIIAFATLVFFWPIVTRISSYSEGGDAMFNAWTIARDQYCILGQDCPRYADGNIYFPNKDTMLYSETQLSAGLLALPLHFINDNPIFSYNVWTITSFFLGGWFMYLLAKYLGRRGHGRWTGEIIAIAAGLIYEFAPFRMPALSHLQNLATLYFPLMVLLTLKYVETRRRRYLAGLLPTLILLFYASWYQMVFGLAIMAVLVLSMWATRLIDWRRAAAVGVVIVLAGLSTAPLAHEYIRFSKQQNAAFPIAEQAYFSAAVKDFAIPYQNTLLGKAYYRIRPHAKVNAYNPDSYSYYGFTLYAVAAGMLATAGWYWYRHRKQPEASRDLKLAAIFWVMIAVGVITSLGPLVKIGQDYVYGQLAGSGLGLVIPGPYLLVDKFVPQLMFIRALGRWGILILFALCCMLAMLPGYLERLQWRPRKRRIVYAAVLILAFVELAPLQMRPLLSPQTSPYAYNIAPPKAWQYVKQHKEINNIVVLYADPDYPNAPWPFLPCELELWAGYTNRNVFNGYSGYNPPSYKRDLADFIDFRADDVAKMKRQQLRYVMVNKQVSKSRPQLTADVARVLRNKVYEDNTYALFKIP